MTDLDAFRSGLDTAEIARLTNRTEAAVYNHIQRLRVEERRRDQAKDPQSQQRRAG